MSIEIINALFQDNLSESTDSIKEALGNKIIQRLDEMKKDVASTLCVSEKSTHYLDVLKLGPNEPDLNPDKGYDSDVFHGKINTSVQRKSKATPKNVAHVVHEPKEHHKEDLDISILEDTLNEGILDGIKKVASGLEKGIDTARTLTQSKSLYGAYKALKPKPVKPKRINEFAKGEDIGKPNIGPDTGFENLANKAGNRVAAEILQKILHKK